MGAAWSDILVRAASLLGLTLLPSVFSPDPEPPFTLGVALLCVLAVLVVGGALWWLRRRVENATATAAAVLGALALVAAVAMAWSLRDGTRPLGSAVPLVAVPVWGALACAASAVAGEWLGSSFKHKRMAGPIAVLALGITQLGAAGTVLRDAPAMWGEALRREPGHERAAAAVGGAHLAARRFEEARAVAVRCLAARPRSCTCLEMAARAAARAEARDRRQRAEAAVQACPDRGEVHALLAEALVREGDLDGAARAIEAARAGGAAPATVAWLEAVLHERAGRLDDAAEAAARALAAGAGRDARLLRGRVLLAAGRLDEAAAELAPLLRTDANDVDATWGLAAVADKRGDHEAARRGYLASIRIDPRHADARHDLALLTYRLGKHDEARQHARRFAEDHPADARREALLAAVGAGGGR
jgi:tetratricopeptide (TPR) repeat protein